MYTRPKPRAASALATALAVPLPERSSRKMVLPPVSRFRAAICSAVTCSAGGECGAGGTQEA